jgi:hypothetical protein
VLQRRISLVLEGRVGPELRVHATDFVRLLQLLLAALRDTERSLHPSGGSTLNYEIVDLRHGSPATVVIEAHPVDPKVDLGEKVISDFLSVVRQLDSGKDLIDHVANGVLENLAGMVAPIGKSLARVTIQREQESYVLMGDFRRRIEIALSKEESYPGAFRGMLEAINIHRDANIFRIYPDVGPSKVTCRFPSELENEAVKAIGHFVEVRGILKYRVTAPYPHEIAVESIEAFPHESELPSLMDLRGVAPEATGAMNSEDFIRQLRDATN